MQVNRITDNIGRGHWQREGGIELHFENYLKLLTADFHLPQSQITIDSPDFHP